MKVLFDSTISAAGESIRCTRGRSPESLSIEIRRTSRRKHIRPNQPQYLQLVIAASVPVSRTFVVLAVLPSNPQGTYLLRAVRDLPGEVKE